MSLPPTDWLPVLPDRMPPRAKNAALRSQYVAWAPFSYEAYPTADLLAGLTFQPTFPDRMPRQPVKRQRFEVVTGALVTPAVAPVSWLPIYPNTVPRRKLSPALRTSYTTPTFGWGAVIAQQMAWRFVPPVQIRYRQYTYRRALPDRPLGVGDVGAVCRGDPAGVYVVGSADADLRDVHPH
jgi:hypothetical protein